MPYYMVIGDPEDVPGRSLLHEGEYLNPSEAVLAWAKDFLDDDYVDEAEQEDASPTDLIRGAIGIASMIGDGTYYTIKVREASLDENGDVWEVTHRDILEE